MYPEVSSSWSIYANRFHSVWVRRRVLLSIFNPVKMWMLVYRCCLTNHGIVAIVPHDLWQMTLCAQIIGLRGQIRIFPIVEKSNYCLAMKTVIELQCELDKSVSYFLSIITILFPPRWTKNAHSSMWKQLFQFYYTAVRSPRDGSVIRSRYFFYLVLICKFFFLRSGDETKFFANAFSHWQKIDESQHPRFKILLTQCFRLDEKLGNGLEDDDDEIVIWRGMLDTTGLDTAGLELAYTATKIHGLLNAWLKTKSLFANWKP